MNNHKKKYDYGSCHVCGERMLEKKMSQDFWLKGKLVVIEAVSVECDDHGGEEVVKT